jgi:GNAT superfamily N-acetyltransferase
MSEPVPYEVEWRGPFTSSEANTLHAEAFGTRVFTDLEWDWRSLVERHSLGWVVARDERALIGFVNVISDGLVHAWLQDTMVAIAARRLGIGKKLVEVAIDGSKMAGCEWMHVDFEDDLRSFYFEACGFAPTNAGLIHL